MRKGFKGWQIYSCHCFLPNPVKLNIYFKEAFACSLTFSFSLSFSLSFYFCPFCCWPGIEVGLIRKASRFYLRSVKPRKEKKLESERIVLSTFAICKGKEQKILAILLYFSTKDLPDMSTSGRRKKRKNLTSCRDFRASLLWKKRKKIDQK